MEWRRAVVGVTAVRKAIGALVVVAAILGVIVHAQAAANAPYRWGGRNGPVYLNWDGSQIGAMPLDPTTGVPMVDYGGRLGRQTNPTTVAQWGLDALVEHDQRRALLAADWLVEHQGPDGAWRYTFRWVHGAKVLAPGWASAMTNGNALSLLARVYDLTSDSRYLDAARRAVDFLDVPIEQGGVRTTLGGGVWYDEYPDRRGASYVLNGFMFTLVGLWDVAAVIPAAQPMYDAGRATLDANLHRFDVDGFAAYDLLLYPWVDRDYDEIHASLLQAMLDERPSGPVAKWLARWY